MLQRILNIARFTLLEGWRGRLIAIVVAVIVIAVIAAEFAAELAITESNSFRIAIYAGFCRIALVFIVMLFTATSVVRELNERMLDLTLSRPVSRASWMCGRLLGLWMLGGIAAVLCSLPLLSVLAPATAVVWGVFFAIELAIVATATMTCVVTLRHVTLNRCVVIDEPWPDRRSRCLEYRDHRPGAGAAGPGVAGAGSIH
ncbi:MAG: hypothetical protein ACPHUF_11925 [Gammaproteobacteria bacterium]